MDNERCDQVCADVPGFVPAGHRCSCIMVAGHGGRHGCHCGAMWSREINEEEDA